MYQATEQDDFLVFPNPATTAVFVHFSGSESKPFTLQDASGRMVLSGSVTSGDQLNTTAFERGLYLLTIGNSTQKVLFR